MPPPFNASEAMPVAASSAVPLSHRYRCSFGAAVLYPPLTFLKPTGKTLSVPFKGRMFTVVEVTPQFGG